MKTIWSIINRIDFSKETKNIVFIASVMIFGAFLGFIFWIFIGQYFLSGLSWELCLIGYPILFNVFLSTIYLYTHDFDDK